MMQDSNPQLSDAEIRLIKKLDRRNRELQILKAISTRINVSLDLDYTLNTLLEQLDQFFEFRHSMILLANPNENFISLRASHGYPDKGTGARVGFGKGVIGTVAKRKKMLNVPNIATRVAYLSGTDVMESEQQIMIKLPGLRNPKSQVAFPLMIQDELVGVIAVESEDQRIFRTEDEEIIAIIAEQAAMAIQKVRMYEAEHQRRNQLVEVNEALSTLYRQQQETLNLFKKFVPETVVQKALRDKPESIFDGELLHIAVLFCDIRDFTSVSEKLSPAQVVTLLNNYYQSMNNVIREHEGVVNQFVGDEIFVTFGAPVSIPECEKKSVLCALGMIEQLKLLNAELRNCLGVEIKVGIGINFGPVIAGNLGSDDKIEYSVTGDTVNTGKRIESLTKDKPDTILISQSIYDKVKDICTFKEREQIEVKGKSEKVAVYEVICHG
ncbi:MAG TPA: adenylate/guanylate cyclase domain-containing protein [Saprospiraceae bacterium]|nr:adenylate/guanylate cyclase domain-containing protein [Saprospiraceae bacterium]